MSFFAAFIRRQFISYPPRPTSSFEGKTVIVTGASSGLGLEACSWLIRLGASQVIIACRNLEKGQTAAKKIQATTSCSSDAIKVWHLDMSSYASVQNFSEKVKKELPRVDAIIANAGVNRMNFHITENDEETITTNVVSTSLLAFLLHSKLSETANKYNIQTHFTVTASELYEVAKFKERNVPEGQIFTTLADKKKFSRFDRYNVSKLLGMFVVKQIASMCPEKSSGVIVNCVAPGFCWSELGRDLDNFVTRFIVKLLARPTEVGSRTLVYGASVGSESHGEYLPDCKITPTVGLMEGKSGIELQKRIWLELQQKLEAIQPGVTSL